LKWHGKDIVKMGDIMDAVVSIKTPEEARRFMAQYRKETPYAYQNTGYLSGYFLPDDMLRIMDWFQTSHPIYGRRIPEPDEAFEAGKMMAQMWEKCPNCLRPQREENTWPKK
jgi:hypothetical protein